MGFFSLELRKIFTFLLLTFVELNKRLKCFYTSLFVVPEYFDQTAK